jgi:galactose mutarotase-like enzyme
MKIDSFCLDSRTTIKIAPEFGCNLFSWLVDGREIFYTPPSWLADKSCFYGGGNPILFPAVGRTWDCNCDKPVSDRYIFKGKSFRMPIHGLGMLGTWHKTYERNSGSFVEVEYEFGCPEKMLDLYYPFSIEFCIRYTLKPRFVGINARFTNRGAEPVPFAYGLHPYFNVTNKENTRLVLPCDHRELLDPELLISIGQTPLSESKIAIENDKDYDMVFTGKNHNNASLIDVQTGVGIEIETSDEIQAFVVYSPARENYICLEPWTKGLGNYAKLSQPKVPLETLFSILDPDQKKNIEISYSLIK